MIVNKEDRKTPLAVLPTAKEVLIWIHLLHSRLSIIL